MTRVFELPEFLQDCGADPIHARMLDELPDDIDKTEGGFPWDFTRPTALIAAELLEFYIPEAIKLMFPQWSSGSFLDYLAAGSQTKRKASTYAEAELTLTGEPGTIVPAGTVFATEAKNDQPSIEFAAVENCILDEEGNGTVLVRALLDGKQSNVNAGTIVLMSEPVEGIRTVTNKEKATGGTEEESDDDLRERIMEADASEETSYIGNNADYKRWAKAVDGIGDAIVIPEWNGPETVKIVCLDQNGEGANKTLLDAVYNYIMAPDNPADRLAPPNTILTVAAPDLVNISYSFTVTVADGFELSTVVSGFKKQLESYYKTVANDGAVKYIKVHALLTETPGVEDFTDLLSTAARTTFTLKMTNTRIRKMLKQRRRSDGSENFPTRETAKDMLSMISPIYDRSYVGKWIFQVMAAPLELARETVEDMKNQAFPETATWSLPWWEERYGITGNEGKPLEERRAPDCAEAQHKTPYESVPYCGPGCRNFRAGG